MTTTVCGALKEGLRGLFADTELVVTGGKGRASRRTPHLMLLEAAGGRSLMEASYQAALQKRYLWHEFGDLHLILP